MKVFSLQPMQLKAKEAILLTLSHYLLQLVILIPLLITISITCPVAMWQVCTIFSPRSLKLCALSQPTTPCKNLALYFLSSDRSHQKMGHLSSILCSHKRHIYHSTNKHSLSQDGSSDRSRQKMGHLSSILCSHKRHIYHSTNKHSLSQDGSSDMSRQKMGHLSSILCSHKRHIYHSTNKQPITR